MKSVSKMAAGLFCFVAAGGAGAMAGLDQPGVLNLVHGIPGATVDVCARGDVTNNEWARVAEDFEFKQIGTLELPEGNYDARVVLADDDCDTEALPGLSADDLFLPGGANVSVVARLTQDGQGFGLSVFVNEGVTGRLGSQLVFRHTAAAPTVDARYGRSNTNRVVPDLMFGMEKAVWVLPGRWRVALALPGESDPVLGPAKLNVRNRKSTIVYAVGSAGGGTLDVIVQKID